MTTPEQEPLPTAVAFRRGMKAGLLSSLVLVTVGNFVGIGALAHDLGFSLAWAVLGAVLIWAGPAQVIVMTALAGGAALFGIAIAVALSAVRLLPMVVSLVPLLRGPRTRTRDLILPAHFVSVTTWVEGFRLLPAMPPEERVAFLNGFGTCFCVVAAVSTVAGFYLAAGLPTVLTAAMLMLTPLAFLLSTAGNARSLADRLALVLGLVLGPALTVYAPQLDLLLSGVIGGTLAYLAHRLRERWR
jgi:predicted branched-subunit amino acid permease